MERYDNFTYRAPQQTQPAIGEVDFYRILPSEYGPMPNRPTARPKHRVIGRENAQLTGSGVPQRHNVEGSGRVRPTSGMSHEQLTQVYANFHLHAELHHGDHFVNVDRAPLACQQDAGGSMALPIKGALQRRTSDLLIGRKPLQHRTQEGEGAWEGSREPFRSGPFSFAHHSSQAAYQQNFGELDPVRQLPLPMMLLPRGQAQSVTTVSSTSAAVPATPGNHEMHESGHATARNSESFEARLEPVRSAMGMSTADSFTRELAKTIPESVRELDMDFPRVRRSGSGRRSMGGSKPASAASRSAATYSTPQNATEEYLARTRKLLDYTLRTGGQPDSQYIDRIQHLSPDIRYLDTFSQAALQPDGATPLLRGGDAAETGRGDDQEGRSLQQRDQQQVRVLNSRGQQLQAPSFSSEVDSGRPWTISNTNSRLFNVLDETFRHDQSSRHQNTPRDPASAAVDSLLSPSSGALLQTTALSPLSDLSPPRRNTAPAPVPKSRPCPHPHRLPARASMGAAGAGMGNALVVALPAAGLSITATQSQIASVQANRASRLRPFSHQSLTRALEEVDELLARECGCDTPTTCVRCRMIALAKLGNPRRFLDWMRKKAGSKMFKDGLSAHAAAKRLADYYGLAGSALQARGQLDDLPAYLRDALGGLMQRHDGKDTGELDMVTLSGTGSFGIQGALESGGCGGAPWDQTEASSDHQVIEQTMKAQFPGLKHQPVWKAEVDVSVNKPMPKTRGSEKTREATATTPGVRKQKTKESTKQAKGKGHKNQVAAMGKKAAVDAEGDVEKVASEEGSEAEEDEHEEEEDEEEEFDQGDNESVSEIRKFDRKLKAKRKRRQRKLRKSEGGQGDELAEPHDESGEGALEGDISEEGEEEEEQKKDRKPCGDNADGELKEDELEDFHDEEEGEGGNEEDEEEEEEEGEHEEGMEGKPKREKGKSRRVRKTRKGKSRDGEQKKQTDGEREFPFPGQRRKKRKSDKDKPAGSDGTSEQNATGPGEEPFVYDPEYYGHSRRKGRGSKRAKQKRSRGGRNVDGGDDDPEDFDVDEFDVEEGLGEEEDYGLGESDDRIICTLPQNCYGKCMLAGYCFLDHALRSGPVEMWPISRGAESQMGLPPLGCRRSDRHCAFFESPPIRKRPRAKPKGVNLLPHIVRPNPLIQEGPAHKRTHERIPELSNLSEQATWAGLSKHHLLPTSRHTEWSTKQLCNERIRPRDVSLRHFWCINKHKPTELITDIAGPPSFRRKALYEGSQGRLYHGADECPSNERLAAHRRSRPHRIQPEVNWLLPTHSQKAVVHMDRQMEQVTMEKPDLEKGLFPEDVPWPVKKHLLRKNITLPEYLRAKLGASLCEELEGRYPEPELKRMSTVAPSEHDSAISSEASTLAPKYKGIFKKSMYRLAPARSEDLSSSPSSETSKVKEPRQGPVDPMDQFVDNFVAKVRNSVFGNLMQDPAKAVKTVGTDRVPKQDGEAGMEDGENILINDETASTFSRTYSPFEGWRPPRGEHSGAPSERSMAQSSPSEGGTRPPSALQERLKKLEGDNTLKPKEKSYLRKMLVGAHEPRTLSVPEYLDIQKFKKIDKPTKVVTALAYGDYAPWKLRMVEVNEEVNKVKQKDFKGAYAANWFELFKMRQNKGEEDQFVAEREAYFVPSESEISEDYRAEPSDRTATDRTGGKDKLLSPSKQLGGLKLEDCLDYVREAFEKHIRMQELGISRRVLVAGDSHTCTKFRSTFLKNIGKKGGKKKRRPKIEMNILKERIPEVVHEEPLEEYAMEVDDRKLKVAGRIMPGKMRARPATATKPLGSVTSLLEQRQQPEKRKSSIYERAKERLSLGGFKSMGESESFLSFSSSEESLVALSVKSWPYMHECLGRCEHKTATERIAAAKTQNLNVTQKLVWEEEFQAFDKQDREVQKAGGQRISGAPATALLRKSIVVKPTFAEEKVHLKNKADMNMLKDLQGYFAKAKDSATVDYVAQSNRAKAIETIREELLTSRAVTGYSSDTDIPKRGPHYKKALTGRLRLAVTKDMADYRQDLVSSYSEVAREKIARQQEAGLARRWTEVEEAPISKHRWTEFVLKSEPAVQMKPQGALTQPEKMPTSSTGTAGIQHSTPAKTREILKWRSGVEREAKGAFVQPEEVIQLEADGQRVRKLAPAEVVQQPSSVEERREQGVYARAVGASSMEVHEARTLTDVPTQEVQELSSVLKREAREVTTRQEIPTSEKAQHRKVSPMERVEKLISRVEREAKEILDHREGRAISVGSTTDVPPNTPAFPHDSATSLVSPGVTKETGKIGIQVALDREVQEADAKEVKAYVEHIEDVDSDLLLPLDPRKAEPIGEPLHGVHAMRSESLQAVALVSPSTGGVMIVPERYVHVSEAGEDETRVPVSTKVLPARSLSGQKEFPVDPEQSTKPKRSLSVHGVADAKTKAADIQPIPDLNLDAETLRKRVRNISLKRRLTDIYAPVERQKEKPASQISVASVVETPAEYAWRRLNDVKVKQMKATKKRQPQPVSNLQEKRVDDGEEEDVPETTPTSVQISPDTAPADDQGDLGSKGRPSYRKVQLRSEKDEAEERRQPPQVLIISPEPKDQRPPERKSLRRKSVKKIKKKRFPTKDGSPSAKVKPEKGTPDGGPDPSLDFSFSMDADRAPVGTGIAQSQETLESLPSMVSDVSGQPPAEVHTVLRVDRQSAGGARLSSMKAGSSKVEIVLDYGAPRPSTKSKHGGRKSKGKSTRFKGPTEESELGKSDLSSYLLEPSSVEDGKLSFQLPQDEMFEGDGQEFAFDEEEDERTTVSKKKTIDFEVADEECPPPTPDVDVIVPSDEPIMPITDDLLQSDQEKIDQEQDDGQHRDTSLYTDILRKKWWRMDAEKAADSYSDPLRPFRKDGEDLEKIGGEWDPDKGSRQPAMGRVALSQEACRFELPIDMRELETITVPNYLRAYTVISTRRKILYTKIFNKYKEKGGSLPFKELPRALGEVLVNTIDKEQSQSVLEMSQITEEEKIDQKLFSGLCAMAERILYPQFVTEDTADLPEHQKEKIEKADFFALRWKLEGINVNPGVRKVLERL